ncbi:MAG: DUF4298 domain-containing protein [Oscillospiraceae bacterium]|nr:DUF4298 domain-containing protein [Oscillospiraceae bacterium]
MNSEEIIFAVERIEHLEKIFDEVKTAFETDPDFFENDAMQKKVSLLTQYMESGQWLRDFELDEKGKLPADLKRGILSEDGLYNLVCDIEQSKHKKSGPLINLFDKNGILFAILWIVIYVVGFGTMDGISESIGIPKLLTVIFGAVISAVILVFIKKNDLSERFGLCNFKGNPKDFLFFIPLAVISTASTWSGLSFRIAPLTALLSVIAMCFVGFLEEIIFRGMLFGEMRKNGIKSAIIVSSLTFGVGHIVNLLMGAPVFETLLQLVYASAVGFCYTAIFHKGKSLWPCIISHAAVNSLSVFGAEPNTAMLIAVSAIQTLLGIGYGAWILKKGDQ